MIKTNNNKLFLKNKHVILLFIGLFYSCFLFAQENERVISFSLEYLNAKFFLNLEKDNKLISVHYNEKEYVCTSYVSENTLDSIARVRWFYSLTKVNDGEYEFTLKNASVYDGSFNLIKKNEGYFIEDLRYVKIDYDY